MAKTIDELKSAAAIVRDASEEHENTALRVGQLLIEMIETLPHMADEDIAAAKANAIKALNAATVMGRQLGVVSGEFAKGDIVATKDDYPAGTTVEVLMKNTGLDASLIAYDTNGQRIYTVFDFVNTGGGAGNVVSFEPKTVPTNFGYLALSNGGAYVTITVQNSTIIELGKRISNETIQGSRIVKGTITEDRTSFIRLMSDNMYDKETGATGKYIDYRNGGERSASSLKITNYIPVTPGEDYWFNGNQDSWGYAFYDGSKQLVSFGSKRSLDPDVPHTPSDDYPNDKTKPVHVTAPDGAVYLRVTFAIADDESLNRVNEGRYKAFDEYKCGIDESLLPKGGDEVVKNQLQLQGLLGSYGAVVCQETITNGTSMTVTNYPQYISSHACVSFGALVTGAFTSLRIGFEYSWIVIDQTKIHKYYSDGTHVEQPHGLTISGYIRVAMNHVDYNKMKVAISTEGGNAIINYESWYYLAGGLPTALCNFAGSRAKLGVTNARLHSPIWVIGDSYISYSLYRWPHHLWQMGYDNGLVDGHGGARSEAMYAELQLLLRYGCPKYLLWCLGMNDSGSAANEQGWHTVMEQLKPLCKEKDITLVLATIPNVSGRDHTAKNAEVRRLAAEEGYRYIDFAKAVHGETYGQPWYDGYMQDDVHPNEKGAKALASQVLVDFPEIMVYTDKTF